MVTQSLLLFFFFMLMIYCTLFQYNLVCISTIHMHNLCSLLFCFQTVSFSCLHFKQTSAETTIDRLCRLPEPRVTLTSPQPTGGRELLMYSYFLYFTFHIERSLLFFWWKELLTKSLPRVCVHEWVRLVACLYTNTKCTIVQGDESCLDPRISSHRSATFSVKNVVRPPSVLIPHSILGIPCLTYKNVARPWK